MASALVVLAALLSIGPGTASTQAAGSELTVMTRNLSFGTDLSPILAATNQFEFVTAVATAYTQAQATDFPGRAKAWADEIDHARPDLIGLQEAVLWRTQTPADFSPTPNATTVQADLVGLLLAELRSRGLKYEVVIAQTGLRHRGTGALPGRFGGRPADAARGHPRAEVSGPEADERARRPVRSVPDRPDDHRCAGLPALGVGIGRRDTRRPLVPVRDDPSRPDRRRVPAGPGGRVPRRAGDARRCRSSGSATSTPMPRQR